MKTANLVILTALACTGALTACGSGGGLTGDGGVTRNATLDSPDEAARVLAAFALSQNEDAAGAAFDSFGRDDVCNQGGDTDDSSLSGNTITVNFNDCQTRFIEGNETVDSLLDGRLQATCNDGVAACNNISATLGNGPTPLLADARVQENGTTTQDIMASIRGDLDFRSLETADTTQEITTSSVRADIADQHNNRSFTLRSEQLTVDVIENKSSGATSTRVDGTLSITGLTNCLNGGIDISTENPVITDSAGDTSAGNISLTNNSGQTATVEFISSGDVSITANGTIQTYTDSDLESFCN